MVQSKGFYSVFSFVFRSDRKAYLSFPDLSQINMKANPDKYLAQVVETLISGKLLSVNRVAYSLYPLYYFTLMPHHKRTLT